MQDNYNIHTIHACVRLRYEKAKVIAHYVLYLCHCLKSLQENDYCQEYFDNGEGFAADDDDNMDDGPTY